MIYIHIEISPPVLEKKIFEGFLPYMGMAAILVMGTGFLIYTLVPPIDASYKIWLCLAKWFQRRRSLKLWTDRRQTDAGSWPSYELIRAVAGQRSSPDLCFATKSIKIYNE